MKNGEFQKEVTNNKEEIEEFEKINLKKKETNEVSVLLYLHEEKLLITGSTDSIIKVYDESEPDETNLLKVISGGHEDSEITALAYSPLLSLLASGSSNSLICIWDLELCKMEDVCKGHQGEITAL